MIVAHRAACFHYVACRREKTCPRDLQPGMTEIRPEVIKLFSCSTQLSTFQLLIKTKIPTNKDVS